MKSKRLFFAIPITPEFARFFGTASEAYPGGGIRWTPPENLHLTVRFLGNVPESQLPALTETTSHLLQSTPPFQMELRDMAPGPDAHRPTMIWGRFLPSPEFEKLATNLGLALLEFTQKKEDWPPNPHVTLARFNRNFQPAEKLPAVQAPAGMRITVNGIELWESRLNPGTSEYSCLHRFEFGKTDLDLQT